MKRFQMLLAAFAVTLVSVSCTPTPTPASTTTSEVAATSTSTSIVQNNELLLVDANGVELGKYLDPSSFYSTAVKRVVVFAESNGRLDDNVLYHEQSGCNGKKYIDDRKFTGRNPYLYVFSNAQDGIYIVEDTTPKSSFKPLSYAQPNGACVEINPDNETIRDFYEVQMANVPFSYLLNFPLKFKS